MSKKTIKIAQISDSHLLSERSEKIHGINPYQRLARVINHIEKNQYDLILFTGDIANNGDEKSYQQLLELTSSIGKKIFIIPGNHDDPDQFKKILSSSALFIITPKKPIKIKNWCFIFLDTIVKSENYGHVSDSTMRHFSENLKKTREFNICVLMHHHPFNVGIPCVDKYKICNFNKVKNALTKNVKIIVYGHVHNDYTAKEDIIYTSCPSTCFQFIKGDKIDDSIYGFKEYILSGGKMIFHTIWFSKNSIKRK